MWIVRSFARGFANLLDFRGRDTEAQFWPYCLLIVAIATAAYSAALMPVTESIIRGMGAYIRAHPDQGTIMQGGDSYTVRINGFPPEVMELFRPVMIYPTAYSLGAALLLAAAVARRLRDAGRSPFLGLLPLASCAIGLAGLFRLFSQGFELPIFLGAFVGCLGYAISIIVLIVLLVRPSSRMPSPTP